MGVGAPLEFAYVLLRDWFCAIPNCQAPTGLDWANTGQTLGQQDSALQTGNGRPANTPGLTKNSLSWYALCTTAPSYFSLASAWARCRPVKKGHCRTGGSFCEGTSEKETLETPHEGRLCAQLWHRPSNTFCSLSRMIRVGCYSRWPQVGQM